MISHSEYEFHSLVHETVTSELNSQNIHIYLKKYCLAGVRTSLTECLPSMLDSIRSYTNHIALPFPTLPNPPSSLFTPHNYMSSTLLLSSSRKICNTEIIVYMWLYTEELWAYQSYIFREN